MFGFIKNLLRKLVEAEPEQEEQFDASDAVHISQPLPAPPPPPAKRGRTTNGHHSTGKGIELPLEPILKALPLEVQPRVREMNVSGATIYIPLEKILAQLPRGVVTISFGDLRRAAPSLFNGGVDRDEVLVPLPLSEILSRLDPSLINRKPAQRHIEVPGEISSPFDVHGRGLMFSIKPAAPEPTVAPAPSNGKPSAPVPVTATRSTVVAAPSPQPPTAPQVAAPALAASRSIRYEPPEELPAPQPAPSTPTALILVSLTALADAWPEAVRHEIVQLNLVDAKVGLPAEAIEKALKQGRIAFSWKNLRSWIKPSPLPSVSAHDGAVLELPLKVVTPLFLARQKEKAKGHQKVSIDENIPNLFFGFPQPEPANVAAEPVPAPVQVKPDTNYYVWDDSSDTVRMPEPETFAKRPSTPGTSFVVRYATPNEVVSRAAALEGVAGALIALPDGLMVANQVPPELNGDTLAAFLPQIFGKISQCTKELRMGELNNVNFTVGNVPWKIFRVNAIFFAAFGRAGEPLPTAQLAALAAELDHKGK